MRYEFKLVRRVEFADTDMAGIVHFANYFRYMEEAEHAFFRSFGASVHRTSGGHARNDARTEGWVRVRASAEYMAPLVYPQPFEVRLFVREIGATSLTYAFSFGSTSSDAGGGVREVARGALKVVHVVRADDGATFRAAPIPPIVAANVRAAPPELLSLHDSFHGA